jgi:glutamate/tyrosine decarboxylase-like PLP-dependent enzyme
MSKKKIFFPKSGLQPDGLMRQMAEQRDGDLKWQDGKAFSLMYYPGEEKEKFIQEAFNMYFAENALNPMTFPSLRKMETEVISMVADLMGGDELVRGSFTSGGTESILLAVKSARDHARKLHPEIKYPEMVLPATAHPSIVKSLHYFDIKGVFVPVKNDFTADSLAMEKAITKNTIMLMASAPSYPHGVIDPVAEIAAMAEKKGIWLHVDACIGFILPFIKKLGYEIPEFDLSLPGVTSLSTDIHKYGYAPKGASVVLYRNTELRRNQFTVYTDWPGGIYGSLTMAGSRPGGTIAAAWAAIKGIGEDGYMEMAERTMQTTNKIREFVDGHPELEIMGTPPMSILAFTSNSLDVFELADELSIKGWHFDRLCSPPGIHLTITQMHDKVVDEFLGDLQLAVASAKQFKMQDVARTVKIEVLKRLARLLPEGAIAKVQAQFSGKAATESERTAPIYGMLGALSGTEDLDEIITNLLDKLNSPE